MAQVIRRRALRDNVAEKREMFCTGYPVSILQGVLCYNAELLAPKRTTSMLRGMMPPDVQCQAQR
jgi:hypothetical protein